MSSTFTTRRRTRRHALGAVMAETVLILPFIMLVVVLIIYLGWNFRRLSQVTNMDRYVVWKEATPGAPGPDAQRRDDAMRNPRLDETFFGLTDDQAETLDELRRGDVVTYIPEGHDRIRDQQTDETYSYFDEFLRLNPRANIERFDAEHRQISPLLERIGMSNLTRNVMGSSRMNGDWRYVNGVRYDGEKGEWEPAFSRVSPGDTLREVFFAELDDGLEPYVNDGNKLARAIREFYTDYPAYRGPDVTRDSLNTNLPDIDDPGEGF